MPTGCNPSCPCVDGESGLCDASYVKYGDYKHVCEDFDKRPLSCPIKSVDELIEKITAEKVCKTKDYNAIGTDSEKGFDMGLLRAIKIIKEYCEELKG